MNIEQNADHILLWKDENGWHTEDYGNQNLIPIHGDIGDVIAEGSSLANENCMQDKEVWLVKVEFIHKFQPKR